METITIDDLQKLDIRVGTIVHAEKVENADKLLKLTIDFGEETRTILTAMAMHYSPEHFVGKQMPFIMNLEPRKIRGIESQGMILAADTEEGPALLHPERKIPNGSKVI